MARPVAVPPRLIGWGMLGFAGLGEPGNAVTETMLRYVARIQFEDGHWQAGLRRPPMGGGEIMTTVLAMRALQLYPSAGRRGEFHAQVERARDWLQKATPHTHQNRVFQLLGLSWTGSTPEQLAKLKQHLLQDQREDGGWAQLVGLPSDAWATGSALIALALSGVVTTEDPVYERGLTFLLRTRFDDGSWFVSSRSYPFQPHFDGGFPHGKDQWISAGATAFATMALALAVEPFADACCR